MTNLKNRLAIYGAFVILFTMVGTTSLAQYSHFYQWGLLPEEKLDMLIAESSGDRAFHHIIEMAGYNRPRPAEEYSGTLQESVYVTNLLKQYGLDEIGIERFGKITTWNGLSGSLHEVSPGFVKLAEYEDLPLMIVSGSATTDTEAPLVWIGESTEHDLAGIDIDGMIVLTSANPARIQNAVVERGALGMVSFYSPRPLIDPLMIPAGGLRSVAGQETFAFSLPPREGHLLRDRLVRGERIIVRAKIESRTEEVDIQVPTCAIKGTDPDAGEIIISAHIFEGYVKQGANDNISGTASILEVARVLQAMIDDGRLERPARTIRFIWIPEFSGTIPWVNAHPDLMKRSLCNINLDMVGLSLSENKSFLVLHRTSYGNAHYIGDVLENYYRYVGETNKMNSVVSGSRFFKRIISPTGTEDPFYYLIENASGGSDHMVFNDWGVMVPGVMLITWPDPYYHTSLDRPAACDPTQLKRSVFITAASAYSIASAKNEMTLNIAGEVFSNASRRMANQFNKAVDMVNKAGHDNINQTLRRSLADIHGTSLGEQLVLNSVLELEPENIALAALVKEYSKALNSLYEGQRNTLINSAGLVSKINNTQLLPLKPDASEKRASSMIPYSTDEAQKNGYTGYSTLLRKVISESRLKDDRGAYSTAIELGKLANGELNLLDIKHIIDAQQYDETNIDTLIELAGILNDNQLIRMVKK